ncbi:MAG: hypothetical protein JNK10_10745 [Cyclobacteriaceae bacterium]|nr:hypothetical protein [Cyclobacteriaceae bacterium]
MVDKIPVSGVRYGDMLQRAIITSFLIVKCILFGSYSQAQTPTSQLQPSQTPPPNLLSSRSVVLYDFNFTQKELDEWQRGFQKAGIDPIAYFETDIVFSGKDMTNAMAAYFVSRQVSFIVILDKAPGFQFTVTPFNGNPTLFNPGQSAWQLKNNKLSDLLTALWQEAWRSQKKANFLISDYPEMDIAVDAIKGNRQEFYAIDLKVDNLAIPKFGNAEMDKALEDFFTNNYPLKFKIVDAGADEQELRRKGFLYVLCFVQTRGVAAKEVLGYDLSKGEKNYASITFPEGQLQLKIIPADQPVYKFYFRHIDNGNIFLGTKWDADVQWLDALRNHVIGFKQELKIN